MQCEQQHEPDACKGLSHLFTALVTLNVEKEEGCCNHGNSSANPKVIMS